MLLNQGLIGQKTVRGELRLVANRFLPYQALIQQHIGRAVVLAEDRKFIVWSASRS